MNATTSGPLLLRTLLGCAVLLCGARVSAQASPPDARVPVPMSPAQAQQQLQNMRDFLVATQEVVGAVARNDFVKAESAARKMGHSEEREKKARAMGGQVPGFVELGLTFFRSADAVGDAARGKNGPAVLAALETTLVHCNGCHAGYKQQVVEPKK